MRDYHLPTPHKANRHPKSISDHANKKNQKIVKKNLNAALSAVSEDMSVFESPEHLIEFTPISEITEDHLISDASEEFYLIWGAHIHVLHSLFQDLTASLSIEATPRSETAASSVLSPLSSTITSDNYGKEVASINQSIIAKSENVNLSCIEAEVAVKHLKEAQFQLFNESTMDLQSKRLLDAFINVIIKEFYGMPDDEGYSELIPRKGYLVFLSFLLLILAATLALILFSGSQHTFRGPTPT
ncbi:hypothetical protein M9H77_36941 [Catharanthus roseus]|uniref:Uncharacterized protein n=1 Tax=Catharanthus roseus TaxID=4058 RepID=A0ACB9ZVT3_CATRO|nr:hypothetical protein M9H77_36941 [Catharanthus roseus]